MPSTSRTSPHRRAGLRLSLLTSLALGFSAVAASSVMAVTVPTDPEPDIACPDAFGDGWLTIYKTTVNTPADSTDWWVSVEFTLADEADAAANCDFSLATYEQADGPPPEFPQTLYASESGTFGVGTHTLTAALPREAELAGCWFQYDFVFGPTIDPLNSGGYGDRQVRSRIGGSDCPDGSLLVQKTDDAGAGLAGATFTVGDLPDPFTSDANGWFCVDGLTLGATVTVTETAPPPGYELADPASQDVTVSNPASCAERAADPTADATFVNTTVPEEPPQTPGGGEQSPSEGVLGGTPTPAPGGNVPDTAADQGSGSSAPLLGLLLLASLGGLVYTRLATSLARRR